MLRWEGLNLLLDDQEKETDESDNVAKFDEFFEADDE